MCIIEIIITSNKLRDANLTVKYLININFHEIKV